MNKVLKLRHIAIIAAVVVIAIGMAVGTVCHFLAGGFFNYGDEFASYKSVEITTSIPEDVHGDTAKAVAEEALSGLGAYQASFSEGTGLVPNKVIYKFYSSASDADLNSAVERAVQLLADKGMEDGTAMLHVNEGFAGGSWQLALAGIALASAVVFQGVYFTLRYKLGMAIAALGTQVASVGLYAALLALTRCPVGLEAIAFTAVVVVVNMICSAIFFDKVKRSYKDDSNAKTATLELVTLGASASVKPAAVVCIAAAAVAVILGLFSFIAAPAAITLAPYGAALIAVVCSALAFAFICPASYGELCGMDRKLKS